MEREAISLERHEREIGELLLKIEELTRRIEVLESKQETCGIYIEGAPKMVKDYVNKRKISER